MLLLYRYKAFCSSFYSTGCARRLNLSLSTLKNSKPSPRIANCTSIEILRPFGSKSDCDHPNFSDKSRTNPTEYMMVKVAIKPPMLTNPFAVPMRSLLMNDRVKSKAIMLAGPPEPSAKMRSQIKSVGLLPGQMSTRAQAAIVPSTTRTTSRARSSGRVAHTFERIGPTKKPMATNDDSMIPARAGETPCPRTRYV